jgi:hypothetical protein
MYPKLLLTNHFWSEEQTNEFLAEDHKYQRKHAQVALGNLFKLLSVDELSSKRVEYSKLQKWV